MKKKFKKGDKRGFTLIELLATIVIVALVLSIGGYGVSKLVGTSKNKSKVISMSSIKESASVYSEEDSDRWIEPYGDDYSYFCTTIEELINKGIIKKDATLPDSVSKSNYVSVKKNRTTLVKSEAVVLDPEEDSTDNKVCTGNDIKEENVSEPSISGNISYTDSLIVNFNDGDDDGIKDKWCQYNTTSTIKDGENVIILDKDDSSCRIDNLKDNTTYYVRVCKTTNGGSRACSSTLGYKTSKFINPEISYSGLTSIIKFDDSGIESGKALHYFKSNISASSNTNIYECDNEFNCSSSTTKNISADTWYKTSDSRVTIDYSNSDGVENGTIEARISDGSKFSEVSSEFTLYKVVFKVGSADSIDGSTSDITKRCIFERGGECSIASPSISKQCYRGMGWSSSSNANSSSWAPGSSKSISSSGTYYPTLGSIITYAINYNANGGYNAPSTQYKTCGKTLTLTYSEPSRSSYIFMGWGLSSYGSAIYDPGDSFTTNSATTLYAIWKDNTYSFDIYKDSGVYRIYYRLGSSGSYTSFGSTVYLSDIESGTYVYYYGVSYSDYEMDSCTYSSPCSVRVTSDSSRYLTSSEVSVESDTYSFSLNKGTGVDSIYVREGTSGSYRDAGVSFFDSSVDYGTRYYYYGVAASGYTMDSCTSTSPCSVYVNSDISKTLTASSSGSSSGGSSTTTTYTVSYNANGGSGEPSSQTKYSGVSLTLSSTKPTRSGYTFKGWATSKNSTTVSYYSGGTYTSNSSITLYAVWESSSSSGGSSTTTTYTVSYSANGGSGEPSSQTKYKGISLTLSSTIPTRSGYTFKGWATSSSSSTVSYYSGDTYSSNSSITLYAVWESSSSSSTTTTYTVTYDANGGSGAPSNGTKEKDKSYTISSVKPTRTTYKFMGWSENKNDTSATWGAGGIIMKSKNYNITLYAVWSDPASSVSYEDINDYMCANGNKYYITKCTSSTCYYSSKNGSSSSGSITKGNLKSCKPSISVSPSGTSFKSGQVITLTCSSAASMTIKEAKIVDNSVTTYGSATLVTTRTGGIPTVFTCTTDKGDSESKTVFYTVSSNSTGSSGSSSCSTKVKCAASRNSSSACMTLANGANAYTYSYDGKGTCYGQFCSSSCPSGSTWTYVNKIV